MKFRVGDLIVDRGGAGEHYSFTSNRNGDFVGVVEDKEHIGHGLYSLKVKIIKGAYEVGLICSVNHKYFKLKKRGNGKKLFQMEEEKKYKN